MSTMNQYLNVYVACFDPGTVWNLLRWMSNSLPEKMDNVGI